MRRQPKFGEYLAFSCCLHRFSCENHLETDPSAWKQILQNERTILYFGLMRKSGDLQINYTFIVTPPAPSQGLSSLKARCQVKGKTTPLFAYVGTKPPTSRPPTLSSNPGPAFWRLGPRQGGCLACSAARSLQPRGLHPPRGQCSSSPQ